MVFIEFEWHIFTGQSKNGYPLFEIEFEPNNDMKLVNEIKEFGASIQQFNLALKQDVKCYKGSVDIIQEIQVKSNKSVKIKGVIYYSRK